MRLYELLRRQNGVVKCLLCASGSKAQWQVGLCVLVVGVVIVETDYVRSE